MYSKPGGCLEGAYIYIYIYICIHTHMYVYIYIYIYIYMMHLAGGTYSPVHVLVSACLVPSEIECHISDQTTPK